MVRANPGEKAEKLDGDLRLKLLLRGERNGEGEGKLKLEAPGVGVGGGEGYGDSGASEALLGVIGDACNSEGAAGVSASGTSRISTFTSSTMIVNHDATP